MEWMRCNSCGYSPSALTSLSVYVTNCGHLVCSQCLAKNAPAAQSATSQQLVCLVCRQTCKAVKFHGPDSQAGPDVKAYFCDPLLALNQVVRAANFHKSFYERGFEMVKRERLSLDIREAQAQGKQLSSLREKLETSQIDVLLQGIREKTEKLLRQAQIQQVTPRGCPGTPNASLPNLAMAARGGVRVQLPQQQQRQGSQFPFRGTPLVNRHGSVSNQGSAVRLQTLTPSGGHSRNMTGITSPAALTTTPQQHLASGSTSVDHRVKSNLHSQMQIQKRTQQWPSTKPVGVTPPARGQATRLSETHQLSRPLISTPLHPLSSVHDMRTSTPHKGNANYYRSDIASLVQARRRAQSMPGHIPGSSLSQASIH